MNDHPIKVALDRSITNYAYLHNGSRPPYIEMNRETYEALKKELFENKPPIINHNFTHYLGSRIIVTEKDILDEFLEAQKEYVKNVGRAPEKIQMTLETFNEIERCAAKKYGSIKNIPMSVIEYLHCEPLRQNIAWQPCLFGVKVEFV